MGARPLGQSFLVGEDWLKWASMSLNEGRIHQNFVDSFIQARSTWHTLLGSPGPQAQAAFTTEQFTSLWSPRTAVTSKPALPLAATSHSRLQGLVHSGLHSGE